MVGTITLSLEVELGWGYHDLDEFDDGRISANRQKETEILRRLLRVCDELDVPFTFDIVGHLLHKPLKSDAVPHARDWLKSIPNGNTHPLFYAPDLVKTIQESDARHELCTHTYTHVPCNLVSNRVVGWELERAQEVHRQLDGEPTVSFVPPRHSSPPKDVMTDHGIEIVRVLGHESPPTRLHKFHELVFDPPEPRAPQVVDGVVETYCTPYSTLPAPTLPIGQQPPLPAFRALPANFRQQLHERYLCRAIEKTIEQDSYLHLWGHLHEIANDSQWDPIRSFLQTLATSRDRGDVRILPMERLNDHVRSEREHSVRVRERQFG